MRGFNNIRSGKNYLKMFKLSYNIQSLELKFLFYFLHLTLSILAKSFVSLVGKSVHIICN